MLNSLITATIFLATLFILISCGVDCIDKKTGMHKSSQTLKEAQEKTLYKFEFDTDRPSLQLDSGLVFTIRNAWVENNWKYECIDNKAEVVKDSSCQFVIDAEYRGEAIHSDYWLENNHLGTVLCYDFSGQDTFTLNLYKDTSYTLTQNKLLTATITFVKRQVSR